MSKDKLIAHAKKFVGADKNPSVLNGIHYAADGSIYATNRHYAIRIKNAHQFTTPATLHPKTGAPIDGKYPDVARVFCMSNFKNAIKFIHRAEFEQAYLAAQCALAVASKLGKLPTVKMIADDGVSRLQIGDDTNHLSFKGFFGNTVAPEASARTLDAVYLVNALAVFADQPTWRTVEVRTKGPYDPILLTNDDDIDIIILPFRTPQ